MRRLGLAIGLFLLGSLTGIVTWHLATEHPANEAVAERFKMKRDGYERLRAMLIEDEKIREVAPWGVRTISIGLPQQPPTPEISLQRYALYQSILADLGALSATRSDGPDPSTCILVWTSGWAGGAIHVEVCRFHGDTSPLNSDKPARYSYFSLGDHWFGVRDDM
ncbi:hypothetical protein SSBR45G_04630 [Bradyrhizobium sp. SSBR45G]|uniref:hypothetical protein n=1 Tax=unclassified Bradyrhizobium TaxID=2631580 RepID=UPI002342A6DE|nr:MULTISPECIES: hypothetical protein [unclassified Bradyrhizobium]GLH75555.1 hypothetical protein SSBR45G_04630 [Bradyrhizobium sp. SSBR45G]GLH82658.1 hypothetical protein SSBR45R_01180 [Bradyrhizobium sp. SSBR45R]